MFWVDADELEAKMEKKGWLADFTRQLKQRILWKTAWDTYINGFHLSRYYREIIIRFSLPMGKSSSNDFAVSTECDTEFWRYKNQHFQFSDLIQLEEAETERINQCLRDSERICAEDVAGDFQSDRFRWYGHLCCLEQEN